MLAVELLVARLVHDLSWHNAFEVTFLLLTVWWAWVCTTWMTSWFHPDVTAVRLVLLFVMVASQFMAVALPTAFGDGAALFVISYLVLQVGRNLFNVIVIDRPHALARALDRLLAWSLFSTPLWIAGLLADDGARIGLWCSALALEYGATFIGYATPGLGRSSTSDWTIKGSHFAERFQQFVLIALGEAVVVTGVTASGHGLSATVLVALGISIVTSALLWWLYFHAVAQHSEHHIASAADPGRLGRNGFTFGHIPIIAGIVLDAAGSEVLIAHSDEHLHLAAAVALMGGPALYLIGHNVFRYVMVGTTSWKRWLTCAVLLALVPVVPHVPALVAGVAVVAILTTLVVAELLHGRRVVAAAAAAR